ncbi:hypothetical protein [Mesorhizobium sp. M0091]|uniref:hypothetical protein n=1 Tax=Mesorhizobium sp. M0091 TaxID=2956875 RepID=UPI003337F2B9
MGIVDIQGKVDVFQYWPHGSSDVDTLKFIPDLASAQYVGDGASTNVGAFFERGGTFQPDDNNPGEEKFKSILRKAGGVSLSVRLQGIDAPETHYSPNYREGMFDGDYAKWIAKHIARQKSYRQPYGKLCTDLFANGLRTQLGIGSFNSATPEVLVDAKVRILADGIDGAVDVFGRVLGYVTLIGNGLEIVLNDHALTQGFAFCSFYGSMAIDEMKRLSDLFATHGEGGAQKSQLRSNVSGQLRDFEYELWTTKSMRDTDRDDNGADSFRSKCFDPKLFRRCIDWVGRKEALGESTALLDYMRSNDEDIVLLSDFVAAKGDWNKSRKFALGFLIAKDGAFSYKTGEVVFESRPVEIVNDQHQPLPKSFLTPYP